MHTTMKRYIHTLLFGVLLSLTSCVMDDPFIDGDMPTPGSDGGLHIIGSAADFDPLNVGTRADGNAYPDSYISEMTMFVFKNNGDLIQGYDASQTPTSSAINIQQSNPTFLIEAKKYDGTGIISSMGASLNIKYFDNKAGDISACSIYIVANAYHQIKHLIDGNDANGEIKKLSDLNEVLLTIDDTLAMPKKEDGTVIGFPMIGNAITADNNVATFNLKYSEDTSSNAVANIPLTKVYSKVCFTMQVVAKQVVKDGPTPKFQLTKVEVFNLPSKAHLGYIAGDYATEVCGDNLNDENIADYYHYDSVNDTPVNLNVPVQTIYHNSSTTITESDVIKFQFYMPEHMVTPNPIPYPENIPDDRKQYYKPKGVAAGSDGTGSKIATFVRIHGSYTDHNGRIKGVSYDIYLGQNEKDDFEIKRNQQLNNFLIITGLTNHKDAYFGNEGQYNISIDHRVTMTDRGYNVYMEREAILDSHFEVRPVDFELQNGSAITIVIPKEYQSWIAMESDAVACKTKDDRKYIDLTNEKRGVRKYFTTDLVSELTNVAEHTITMDDGRSITTNKDEVKGTITLEHSSRYGGLNKDTEHFRVWFYVDENPNVYDETGTGKLTSESGDYTVDLNQYRLAPVKLYYTNTATDNPDIDAEAVHTINFQQWNLWRVWSQPNDSGVRERYYDIEHEEEYLYNFASDDQYGQTKEEGMPWGLNEEQLSKEHRSFTNNTNNDSWNTYINSNTLPTYDFYIAKHDGNFAVIAGANMVHRYAGQHFTSEIFENSNGKVKHLTMYQPASGAVEYCYNKNKRNSDGSIAEVEWYLPSADELEDFIVAGYSSFKEFQDNYYWTSQPAYIRNVYYYEDSRNTFPFIVYDDNPTYARATKVVAKGNDVFEYALSGLNEKTNVINPSTEKILDFTGSGEINFGYFYMMYRWKNGSPDTTFGQGGDFGGVVNGIQYLGEEFGEKLGGSSTNTRYHIHLGHLYDMTQEGYHLRTKSNRVRCVRKDYSAENEQMTLAYNVSLTPATSLDTSGNTLYVMSNTAYQATYLTTSNPVAAEDKSAVGKDNLVIIQNNKIKSVDQGLYFNRDSGNASLGYSATSFTISNSSGSNFTISCTEGAWLWKETYYLKQTGNNSVSMNTDSGNSTWYFYEVTIQ